MIDLINQFFDNIQLNDFEDILIIPLNKTL